MADLAEIKAMLLEMLEADDRLPRASFMSEEEPMPLARCPRCQSHDLYAIDAYQGIMRSLGCLTCGHVWEDVVEHFVPGDYRKAVDIEGEL